LAVGNCGCAAAVRGALGFVAARSLGAAVAEALEEATRCRGGCCSCGGGRDGPSEAAGTEYPGVVTSEVVVVVVVCGGSSPRPRNKCTGAVATRYEPTATPRVTWYEVTATSRVARHPPSKTAVKIKAFAPAFILPLLYRRLFQSATAVAAISLQPFNPSTQQPLQQNRQCLDRSPTMSISRGRCRAQ